MMSGVKPLAWPAEMVPEDPDRHAEHRRTDRAADNPGNRRIEADMFLDPLVGLVAQGLIPVRLGCDQTKDRLLGLGILAAAAPRLPKAARRPESLKG